jgi:PLP dependent protein
MAEGEKVADRLAGIRGRVVDAARRAGRDPSSVTLLAVSKGQPVSAIREAYDAGQRDFGESYAQELAHKAIELADLADLSFHFIGRLQRNKARDVARVAVSVHAVDREALAIELSKRAVDASRQLSVYLEVNVSGEASKGGAAPDEVEALASQVEALPGLSLSGLMTIPPATDDPERARPVFAELRRLRDRLLPSHPRLAGLSMGMTSDFEVAIAEGATVVRVGTAIFGPRLERTP